MDRVGPVKVKKIMSKQKTPWRTTMMVSALKRECRKAERKWRKTKLQIHYDIYEQSLGSFNNELRRARQQHLSWMINKNINNTRTLFVMVDKLTNPIKQIASELMSTEKYNEFVCFFSEKTTQSNKDAVPSPRPQRHNLVIMSHLHTIDKKIPRRNSSTS